MQQDGTIDAVISNGGEDPTVLPMTQPTGFFDTVDGATVEPMEDKHLCEMFGKGTTEPEEPKQGRLSEPDATKEAFLRVNAVIPATRELQTQYMELLLDYHDVVSIGKFDLGWTDAL